MNSRLFHQGREAMVSIHPVFAFPHQEAGRPTGVVKNQECLRSVGQICNTSPTSIFPLKIRWSNFSPSKKLPFWEGSGIRAIMGFQQTSFTSTTAISRHLPPSTHPGSTTLAFSKKNTVLQLTWLRSKIPIFFQS